MASSKNLGVLFLRAINSRTLARHGSPCRRSCLEGHRRLPTATAPRQPPTGLPPAAHLGPGLPRRHPGQARPPAAHGTSQPGSAGQVGPPCAPGAPNGSQLASSTRSSPLDLSEVDGSLHKAPCGGEGPAPTPSPEPRSAGSGRSRPTCSGSRSAGSSTARTATTPTRSNRPCKPSPRADCS